jgi:hypothetical protein
MVLPAVLRITSFILIVHAAVSGARRRAEAC